MLSCSFLFCFFLFFGGECIRILSVLQTNAECKCFWAGQGSHMLYWISRKWREHINRLLRIWELSLSGLRWGSAWKIIVQLLIRLEETAGSHCKVHIIIMVSRLDHLLEIIVASPIHSNAFCIVHYWGPSRYEGKNPCLVLFINPGLDWERVYHTPYKL